MVDYVNKVWSIKFEFHSQKQIHIVRITETLEINHERPANPNQHQISNSNHTASETHII